MLGFGRACIAMLIVLSIAMKVIQLTMDADLVRRVDRRAKRLGTTRSGFTREALRAALERYDEEELEELHRAGYREKPPSNQEFGIPEADHAWGDGPWKDE